MSELALAPDPAQPITSERLPTSVLATNIIGVVTPLIGFVAAILLCWGWAVSWVDLGLLASFYVLSALGITVGYHRLFTHRSFRTTRTVRFILAVFGSMAAQGTLLQWVAQHRRHHAHSDQPGDPHSPHLHRGGIRGVLYGVWHSHVGWIFKPDAPDLPRYVPDLYASRMLRVVSALTGVWVILGVLLPGVVGGLVTGSWAGAWTGLLWGGLVRIFLVHHVTWSVNSVCHLWGSRPYHSDDRSRNNFIFGVLAMGEGWHHTHHVFPTSARHGLRWWQIDVSYYFIRALKFVGLAYDVKVPSKKLERSARRTEHA